MEAAEGWIEWQDVDEGTVFDSEGRLLELYLVEDPRNNPSDNRRLRWFRTSYPPAVRVRPLEDEPEHQEELRAALLAAFAAIGDARAEDSQLEDLCREAAARFLIR